MIRKLKIKFIILSMTSLFVLLCVIVVGMNLVNLSTVINEADETLSFLFQNKGGFPDLRGNKEKKLPPNMSPELPFESRYFSVLFDNQGNVIYTDTSNIAAVDSSMAIEYADKVADSNESKGFAGNFRFVKISQDTKVRITFLDCGRKLDAFRSFLFTSSVVALSGFIIVFFVISFFAGKIIQPIAESYEKQRRFITDAGHEIKTPLTIINANVDVLEMDFEKNECLEDIKLQAKRLTELTNELVLLARMEESENSMQMIDFPVSEIVTDTATPFKTLAKTQKKEFICNIQPMLSMKGNDRAIVQLVSILMDNAMKYSPVGGTVTLNFFKQGKTLRLTVSNTTESDVPRENLNLVFDRFYRTDASRNSETGGYGIGLSVAKAIVKAHGGKIFASSEDIHSFQINVILPI